MIAIDCGGLTQLWDISDLEKIKDRLTFKKFEYQTRNYSKVAGYMQRIVRGHKMLFVPRHFLSQNLEIRVSETRCNTCRGGELPVFSLNPGKKLFWNGVDQEEFISQMCNRAKESGSGGYGISPCGTGKTLMGIEMSRRLGRYTLIILNRRYQVKQWVDEFENSFRFPEGLYGIYQAKRRDRFNPYIIGTIKTLLKEKDPAFFTRFGTVIFDEGHHLPAATWLDMIARLRSTYIFALTAGFHRTDGLDKMFACLLGDTLAEAKAPRCAGGRADMLHFLPPFKTRFPQYGKALNRMQIASFLSRNEARTSAIGYAIWKLYWEGRQVLVFSDIKDHLHRLRDASIKRGVKVEDIGYFVGGMKDHLLEEGGKRQVTFVTYEMGKESMNLPWKDTAVCCTPPPSNQKQLKGRIDRVLEGKIKVPPYILDFVDPGDALLRQGNIRSRRWAEEGLLVNNFVFGGNCNGTSPGSGD